MKELFEQEYPKYEKSLFLVAAAYMHNTEDAWDALQEGALSAYLAMDTLKHREHFKTWLTRIVINKCKNRLKARRFTEELDDSLGCFCAIPTEEIEIIDAICRMDRAESVYITLRFYNDMNYAEVAKALKQPVSTVKYRTGKALKKLKELMEGDV